MITEWDPIKNQKLKQERGICFDDIVISIAEDRVLDITSHYNPKKYPNQYVMIVEIAGYVYLVPFVIKNKETIFLKTVFPHRKSTKDYLINKTKK